MWPFSSPIERGDSAGFVDEVPVQVALLDRDGSLVRACGGAPASAAKLLGGQIPVGRPGVTRGGSHCCGGDAL